MKKVIAIGLLFSMATTIFTRDLQQIIRPNALGNNDSFESLFIMGVATITAGVCYKIWEQETKELAHLALIEKEIDVRGMIRERRDQLYSLSIELEHDFKNFNQLSRLKEECRVSQGEKIFEYDSEPCKMFTTQLDVLHKFYLGKKLDKEGDE